MSRVLSQLLDAKEPMFTMALNQLEQTSGRPSVDVRLIADISANVRQKVRELGLDPNDTTDKELYHALQNMTAMHDEYLAKAIGTDSKAQLTDQLKAIQHALATMPIARSCWVIKHSVAKRLLKALPPKNVMKQLGYKSIDSMLKRQPVAEIFTAVRFMETAAWQTRLVKSYRKLIPSDFETREVDVLLLDRERWGDAADTFIHIQHHNITHLKELGVIMILPIPVRKLRGVVITVMPLALHYINEIRSYSAFFKMQQVRSDFGGILVRTILDDPKSNATIAGQPVHWRVIQRHFGKSSGQTRPESFEPHVQIEDLFWQKAEEVLYRLEPTLKFWEGMDYSATTGTNMPVPLGLMDNAVSYCNKLPFEGHTAEHFKESLWNEIYARYMGQESIEAAVIEQLSDGVIVASMDGVT